MTLKQAMLRLKAMGTAQTRKTYGRHGVTGEMFGVKYGDLEKLVREIKTDHDLALQLWETGNHDARVLATKIADPKKVTARLLTAWLGDVNNHVLSAGLSDLAGSCSSGRKAAGRWRGSGKEWTASTGWLTLSGVLRVDPDELTRSEARSLLGEIERRIHASPNRVKYSMNTALIAIGSYMPRMEEEAIRVARRIGQVQVDHGLTHCTTPLAAPYIKKAAAHHRAKLARGS